MPHQMIFTGGGRWEDALEEEGRGFWYVVCSCCYLVGVCMYI